MPFFVQVSNPAGGVVINRAEVADPSQWPHDLTWIQNDVAQIGWLWDGASFSPPGAPYSPPPDNFPALIVRRANAMAAAGDKAGALLLLVNNNIPVTPGIIS